jgi:hypothetical protein
VLFKEQNRADMVYGSLMEAGQQALEMLRSQIPTIMLGSIFVFVGAGALVISAVRRRERMWILLWFGLFSGFYGPASSSNRRHCLRFCRLALRPPAPG